jgi:hypothetical protein
MNVIMPVVPGGIVPSLRDSCRMLRLPGTDVPGYRLYRPYGTAASLCKKNISKAGPLKPQISALRSPGFPVETRGVGVLHATLSTESRTRGRR